MKKNIIYIALLVFSIVTLSSCDDKEGYSYIDIFETKTKNVSGDWFVQTFVDGEVVVDYEKITTSNTASDSETEFLILDHGNIWEFNVKSPVNVSALTFSGEALPSKIDDYEITVSISNGVIVKDGGTSTTGRTTDSISFDAEFSDDPGTIYHIEGYKKTGFLEDEH